MFLGSRAVLNDLSAQLPTRRQERGFGNDRCQPGELSRHPEEDIDRVG